MAIVKNPVTAVGGGTEIYASCLSKFTAYASWSTIEAGVSDASTTGKSTFAFLYDDGTPLTGTVYMKDYTQNATGVTAVPTHDFTLGGKTFVCIGGSETAKTTLNFDSYTGISTANGDILGFVDANGDDAYLVPLYSKPQTMSVTVGIYSSSIFGYVSTHAIPAANKALIKATGNNSGTALTIYKMN